MSGRTLDAKFYLSGAIEALQAGDATKAIEQAVLAKNAAPRSPTVRETIGLALYATGQFKQALSELQAFRRMTGSRIRDAHIADCYRAMGRPLRAVEYLKDHNDPDAARVKAGALSDAGDAAGAKAALQLGGIPDEKIRPVGSLPVGSVGATADTRRRKNRARR